MPAIELTYLGAAGWRFTAGATVVLLDPHLSRIRFSGRAFGTAETPAVSGDTRPVIGPDDFLVPDEAAIDARITRADFIVVTHSHFNHSLDAPSIAKKTGATVIGTSSTINLARAWGVPEGQLLAVHGGEDFEFGALSVKAIPSLHSALSGKRYFDGRVVPRDVRVPYRLRDDVEGGTLAYLVRFAGQQVLAFGSMNYIEREVEGLRPDVALIASARPRLEIHDYTRRLVRALGFPPVVIATHWDIQSIPFDASQDVAREEARRFTAEVRAASPRTRVIIPEHWEPVTLRPPGRAARRGQRRRRASPRAGSGGD